ncbi:hypothetical protein [Microbispora bryophytorum]|uniref:Uncharacterized protein n=1 Tax=Microbispora bryophytorum subsp. camponoti TaxID=1677852 RepID=A0ABR8LF94_9ACTN|nr:hypothetical protein [Microbispora camponoti]MBD3148442.1 hypothetical protein [Microbispora camponoti]
MRLLPWPRSTTFHGVLPTRVPGIHLTADGRVWFRYGGVECTLTSARAARAAALAEVYAMAAARTSCCLPSEVFKMEQQVALDLATWRNAINHPGLRIKAHVTLTLTAENAKRLVIYEEALRAEHLNQTLAAKRLTHFAETALADVRSARAWWFDQHLSQGVLLDSWESFDTVVRPMVNENTDDAANRFAQVFATAVQRALDDPNKAQDLRIMAHMLLTTAGWRDLADNLPGEADAPSSIRNDTNQLGKSNLREDDLELGSDVRAGA